MTVPQKCKHFRGIQFETCEVGVVMETLTRPLPCLEGFGPVKTPPDTCPKRELMTEEDYAAEARAFQEAASRAARLIAQGLCVDCEKPIAPTSRAGRCLYAACGHRIGQVGR
jgi:hypothetical protein